MFDFLKKKFMGKAKEVEAEIPADIAPVEEMSPHEEKKKEKEKIEARPSHHEEIEKKKKVIAPKQEGGEVERDISLVDRLKTGLLKSRTRLNEGFANLFLGKKEISPAIFEELESLLLSTDMGMTVTEDVLAELQEKVKRSQLKDIDALKTALKTILIENLEPYSHPLVLSPNHRPAVILVVGVNGAGKTTTIGKLAKHLQKLRYSILLAAGDTFRAAAIEQLKIWGERNQVPVVAQESGSDSASVIFDALQSARAKQFEVLIADTAGRLHNQQHLMEELKKVVRVLRKIDPAAPHEILIVLDATLGQNSLNQAKVFHEALTLTGIVLTKLDGTAKGGILFNVAKTLNLPVRFIGVGEGIEDLKPFEAKAFVEALLSEEPPR